MGKSGDNKLLARHFNRIGLVSATPVQNKHPRGIRRGATEQSQDFYPDWQHTFQQLSSSLLHQLWLRNSHQTKTLLPRGLS